MRIIEQAITGKRNQEECEDGIAVNDNFVAVIDGSTSKTPLRISEDMRNGRFAMLVIRDFINSMPHDISMHEFCKEITSVIHHIYESADISISRMKENPTERITASAVIFSRHHSQVWMIGDCHCIVNGEYYDNPKPCEEQIARKRSEFIHKALKNGLCTEMFQEKDTGREYIINELIESCSNQNKEYAVIDGFEIPSGHVKVIDVNAGCDEIVLASDGYPFLKPTLEECEHALRIQLENDPLCIDTLKATKGLMKGNHSFDDRCYIRFSLQNHTN